MKKNKVWFLTFASVLFFAFSLFAHPTFLYGGVQAEAPALPTSLGQEVVQGSSGISDGSLYDALVNAYNEIYAEDPAFVELDTVYVDMFVEVTSLDLSNKLIYNLSGLSLLNFTSLTELNLSQNRISSWNSAVSFPMLTNLNLFDNRLESLDVSAISTLQTLNVNYNNLTRLNVSQMTTGTVLASNNAFTKQSNLALSSAPQSLRVELFNNNITNQSLLSGVTFVFGLQGVSNLEKTSVETTLTIQTKDMPVFGAISGYDVAVQIVDANTSTVVVTLQSENQTLSLPFGSYVANYVDANTLLPVFAETSDTFVAFESGLPFEVVPSNPTYSYLVENEEYTYYSGTLPENSQLVLQSYDENAVLYYKLPSDTEWQTGSVITLPTDGKYVVQIKSVVGQTESEIIAVYVNTAIESILPTWLLATIVLLAISFALIGYVFYIRKNSQK